MFFFASLKIQTFSFTYPDTLFGTVSNYPYRNVNPPVEPGMGLYGKIPSSSTILFISRLIFV